MKVKKSEQTITREEAINLVMRVFDTLEGECNIEYDWRKEHEARDMAIKALEQEQALDKAIAEIADLADADAYGDCQQAFSHGVMRALEIIDKCKKMESEKL